MSAASRREFAATHYTHGIHSTHLVRRELCLQSDCRATHTADSHDRIIPCRSDAQSTFNIQCTHLYRSMMAVGATFVLLAVILQWSAVAWLGLPS